MNLSKLELRRLIENNSADVKLLKQEWEKLTGKKYRRINMKKPLTFNKYNDTGHGWLKCSLRLIEELGIASKISACSYIKGNYAYLEEDCDAPLLLNALSSVGVEYSIVNHYGNRRSVIREYDSFADAGI